MATPLLTDQINLTDEESRIMAVAAGSLLVVVADVVRAPNDKQQLTPLLDKIGALPEVLGRPDTLLADNGYFSEANVRACVAGGVEPLIAIVEAVVGEDATLGTVLADAG